MTDFDKFIAQEFQGQKFIAHCYEGEKPQLKNVLKAGEDALVLIGPEGDFSEEEVKKAIECGFTPISLGKSRLRTARPRLTLSPPGIPLDLCLKPLRRCRILSLSLRIFRLLMCGPLMLMILALLMFLAAMFLPLILMISPRIRLPLAEMVHTSFCRMILSSSLRVMTIRCPLTLFLWLPSPLAIPPA